MISLLDWPFPLVLWSWSKQFSPWLNKKCYVCGSDQSVDPWRSIFTWSSAIVRAHLSSILSWRIYISISLWPSAFSKLLKSPPNCWTFAESSLLQIQDWSKDGQSRSVADWSWILSWEYLREWYDKYSPLAFQPRFDEYGDEELQFLAMDRHQLGHLQL